MQAQGVTVIRPDVGPMREKTVQVRDQLIEQVPEGRRLYQLLEQSILAAQ